MAFEAGEAFVPIIPETASFAALLQKGIGSALSSIKASAASSAGGITKAFNVAGIGIGVALGAATLKGVADFQRLGATVRTLETQLGSTAEQASVLIAQADALGVSTDALSRGFGIFSKNLINGSTALSSYGITAQKTASGQIDFESTLSDLAARFKELPPGIQRTAFVMNVFGRSGKALIPLLSASSDELKTFADNAQAAGLVMSQDDVDAARALGIASRELRASFEGLGVALARAVVPALTSISDALAKVIRFINPVIPAIRDLFVGFLAYKALTFLPTLLLGIATGLEAIGLATASSAVAGIAINLGAAGVAAARFAADVALGVVETTALAYAIGTIPTTPVKSATDKIEGYLKILQPVGSATTALAKANIATAVSLGANREAFVAAISSGKTYAETLHEMNVAAGGVGPALASATLGTRAFVAATAGFSRGVAEIATATGVSLSAAGDAVTKIATDATKALKNNEDAAKAWGKGVKAQLDAVRTSFADFRTQTASSLDLVSSSFDSVVSDTKTSAFAIARHLHDSLVAERTFAENLQTILADGGKGSKLLVDQLLASPSGPAAAATLVAANDRIRASIEGTLRKSSSFADQTATTLQRRLLGTLGDIRKFFDQLRVALEKRLHIDLNDDQIIGAKKNADDLGASILNLTKTPFVVRARADTSAADNAFQGFVSKWAGTQVTFFGLLRTPGGGSDNNPLTPWASGFHGVITKPTLALIGEKGPERVDVGPVGSGGGRISGQLAISDWHRGIASLQAELDHDDFAMN